ncbi:MAG: cache domain-containing protein [Syntrophales bacterium]|jgi:hypothetical protein
MSEMKKDKQLFTVGRIFFLLIVIPLSLMALLIANGIFKFSNAVKERTVIVLDQKSQEDIKVRAINVAEEIVDFLRDRQKDVMIATILPASESAYKEFVNNNRKPLWVKQDGKIVRLSEPLYVEMALINKKGDEVIKISTGEAVPRSKLQNVSNPINTLFKTEDYFAKAKKLNQDEVYVSHVTGWYVNRDDFAKGKRFRGIVRFAAPMFDKEGFSGIITLALDSRHLTRFTDNIIPTQPDYVLKAEADSGNYAYMVDNRGFVIAHPNDYHIEGLDSNGNPVPPLTAATSELMSKKGEEVLDFNLLGFMDPILPKISKDAESGNAGTKTYTFGARTQFVAYAPIQFYSADYPKPGGFGWVGMNVDISKFSEHAALAAKKIQNEAKSWITTIIVIMIVAAILLFFILALLARGITRSIEEEIPEESPDATRFYDDEDEDDK